jgi:hypothetical protein
MKAPTKYELEIFAALETRANWLVRMDNDPADPTYNFEIPTPEDASQAKVIIKQSDAVEVREDFLSIRTPEDALVFFHAYGPWQVKERLATEAAPFKWSQVQRMRGFFEQALLVASPGDLGDQDIGGALWRKWMWGNLTLELPYREPLVAFARCDDIQSALRASVYLTRLAKSRWSQCAKTDCRKVFERKTKRLQLYCCPEHANIQSTRNAMARQESAPAANATKPYTKRKKTR